MCVRERELVSCNYCCSIPLHPSSFGLPQFNLVRYHYLWVITVISPILFIFMIIKSILMLLDIDALKKFYIIHALATIVSSCIVCVLSWKCAIVYAQSADYTPWQGWCSISVCPHSQRDTHVRMCTQTHNTC